MASLKEVKNRIDSVKNMCQIVSAMKTVASTKLYEVQRRTENIPSYQRKLNGILTNFLSTDAMVGSPYTDERPVGGVTIVAFSSNSSLYEVFNSSVTKMLERTLEEYQLLDRGNIQMYPVGKEVGETIKRLGFVPQNSYQEMMGKPPYMQTYELTGTLVKEFLEERMGKVELVYHHFKSTGSQILARDEYLPINLDKMAEEATGSTARKSSFSNDYIVEPPAARLITESLPKVLNQKIYTALLGSSTSKRTARMLAMQAATDNANELIQNLTRQYNKSRR